MSQQPKHTGAPKRFWKVLLGGSLVLNIAVAGFGRGVLAP